MADLTDLFTDSNGTLLSAHTADTGQTWSGNAAEFDIQANRLRNTTNGAQLAIASGDIGSNEYDLTVEFYAHTKEDNIGVAWSIGGANDDYYHLRIESSASGQLQLFKVINGSFTSLGTFAVTALGDLDTTVIRHRSTGIEVDYGATANAITASLDPAISDTGIVGVRSFNAVGTTTGYHIDSMVVTALAPTFAIDSIPTDVKRTEATSLQISNPTVAPTLGNTEVRLTDASGSLLTVDSITGAGPTYTVNFTASDSMAGQYKTYFLYVSVAADSDTSGLQTTFSPATGRSFTALINPDTSTNISMLFGYTGDAPVTGDQVEYEDQATDGTPIVSVSPEGYIAWTGTPQDGAEVQRRVIQSDGTVGVEDAYVFTSGAAPLVGQGVFQSTFDSVLDGVFAASIESTSVH